MYTDDEFGVVLALALEDSEDSDDDVEMNTKLPRSVWVKDWLKSRPDQGFCATLLHQSRQQAPTLHNNFLRMTGEQFDYICELVTPHIQKRNTIMRESI